MLELLLGRTVRNRSEQAEAIQQLTHFTQAFGQSQEGRTATEADRLQQHQWMQQHDAKAAVPTAVIQHIQDMLKWNAFDRGNIQKMIQILEQEIESRSPATSDPS
jgi:hypothetical protein